PDDIPRPEEPRKDKQREKSPSREAGEQQARGETPDAPPKEFGFNSSTLNDILNSMTDEMEKDNKATGNDEPFKPSPGLGMPLGGITKEEAEKLPWICMAFSLKESLQWFIKDPTTAANIRHGSAKNLGTAEKPIKGFARLVKDEEEARTEEEKKKREEGEDKNLLLRGKRKDDKRADKLGWIAWP
ncbi:24963_t:CDS:2, partial [Racocetra persica]